MARFAKQVDPQDLDVASNRLSGFDGPALLVWGAADRFFKLDFARRLRDTFTDASLVEIEDGRTFVPHDEPTRLAERDRRIPTRLTGSLETTDRGTAHARFRRGKQKCSPRDCLHYRKA